MDGVMVFAIIYAQVTNLKVKILALICRLEISFALPLAVNWITWQVIYRIPYVIFNATRRNVSKFNGPSSTFQLKFKKIHTFEANPKFSKTAKFGCDVLWQKKENCVATYTRNNTLFGKKSY